jgi:membrane protease YdiL (CAAX protease family)
MELSVKDRRRTVRNLVLFAIVSLSCGFVGLALDRLSPPQDPMQGLGALVWLISPLAANLILRAVGGDGWADFGLRPNLKSGWKWYLVALILSPIVTIIIFSVAVVSLSGGIDFSGFTRQGLEAYLPLVGMVFVGVMVKNLFEEFAWRGYLTPRFEALRLHPFLNALLTGLIWAGWHVPYYLYFLNRAELQMHTTLNLPSFILLAFLVLPLQALAYGELRLVSKTVWTTWLLHNVANAISLPLFTAGLIGPAGGIAGVLLNPGTAGVFYSFLMALAGFGLYRYRKNIISKE